MVLSQLESTIDDPNGVIPTVNEDPKLWLQLQSQLKIGDSIVGHVICRRPFGVFVDIGYGSNAPALLLVPQFADARSRRLEFEDYPQVGDTIHALVVHIDWDRHKIALTQNQSFDPETSTWCYV